MRLAVCALSAVLMSGCSWLGMGGHSSGYNGAGVYGANCGGYGSGGGYNTASVGCGGGAGGYGVAGVAYGAGAGYGQAGYGAGAGYGQAGYGVGTGYGSAAGYGVGAGYGAGAAGYGAGAGFGQSGYGAGAAGYGAGAGFGQAGYGAGAAGYGAGASGYGINGFQGAQGYGGGAYGAGGGYNSAALGLGAAGAYGAAGYGQTTTLGASAPYGSAVGGAYGTQFGATQYGTQGNVTTVAGAPIYVPQPYPAYYGVPQLRGVPVAVAGGGAMPFGVEFGIGTDIFQDGDIFPGEVAKGNVSAIAPIGYKDAYDNGTSYDVAATYDLDRNTTVLGRLGYSKAESAGPLLIGTNSSSGTTGGTTTSDLYAEFSDLEQYTIEGGVRRYLGGWNNPHGGLRPYVGATGGFTHTDDVVLTQTSATLADPIVQTYVNGGWSPTAAGLVGAEWQVGGRTALGVETGIRWTDALDTNFKSDDTISIPVRLRGRVSF